MEEITIRIFGNRVLRLRRIAALLNLQERSEDQTMEAVAVDVSIDYALQIAEQTTIHGNALAFIHPALLEAINNNPQFFVRLASEPELIEWLEQFVASKISAQPL
jgi:hypothetical protein